MAFTALVIIAIILFYSYTGFQVGQARAKYGIKAPATTGNEDFERIYRVQANTMEWMPIILPLMLLGSYYAKPWIAGLLGLVWLAGRYLYMTGYIEAADKRGMGFMIQAGACAALLVLSLLGVLWTLF